LIRSLAPTRVLVTVGDTGLRDHYRECLDPQDRSIAVALNPIGKVFTLPERAATLDFLFEQLGIDARGRREGRTDGMDGSPLEIIERDNRWRTLILDAFQQERPTP
jgi:hypothetical protein